MPKMPRLAAHSAARADTETRVLELLANIPVRSRVMEGMRAEGMTFSKISSRAPPPREV